MNAALGVVCLVASGGLAYRTAYVLHKLLRDYRPPLPEMPADEPAPVDKGGNAHQRRIQRRAEQRRDKLARV